jgi:hypothetical protein
MTRWTRHHIARTRRHALRPCLDALEERTLLSMSPPADLIAWWPGDGSTTDIVGGRSGTLVGGAGYASGEVSQSFNFNGTDGFVQVPDDNLWAFGSHAFSINMWVNFNTVQPSTVSLPSTVFMGDGVGPGSVNKWTFALGGGQLYFHINDPVDGPTFLTVPFAPNPGQWYNLGVTRSGSLFTFYVDGTVIGTGMSTLAVPDGNTPLTIGGGEGGSNFFMDGRIDEVQIYNRALAPAEVASITAAGSAGLIKQALTTASLTSSVNPSVYGQAVTFTATITTPVTGLGTPTGTVQFLADGSSFGLPVPLAGGTASVTTSTLSAGSHTIQAIYSGDSLFLGSSAGLTQAVQYKFSGFLPPLSTGVSYALGRTIPIKFALADYTGTAVSSPAGVTGLQIVPVNPSGPALTPVSTDGKGLSSSGGQFLFNWKTTGLAAGTFQVRLGLADGTTQSKTVQLKAGGGAAGLIADTSGTSTGATAGALLSGDLTVAVNDPNGLLTADEQARITDAISVINLTVFPYGVTITHVVPSSGSADVTIDTSSTSGVGGYADGVLGCESGTEVTLIQGWNWYAGPDPSAIQAGQFDFETVVMHELGHVLGLGHGADPTSVMYATLGAGTAKRNLTVADLNVPDGDGGGSAGLHARLAPPVLPPAAATAPAPPSMSQNVGLMVWDLAVADLSWAGLTRTQRKRT